jgi:hypothetical protein
MSYSVVPAERVSFGMSPEHWRIYFDAWRKGVKTWAVVFGSKTISVHTSEEEAIQAAQ